jgi:hypothetical protein
MTEAPRIFYRYNCTFSSEYFEDESYSGLGRAELNCETYIEIKKTPKGCWIVPARETIDGLKPHPFYINWIKGWKFVLDRGRKRYAYEDKDLALKSFIKRKTSQVNILRLQLKRAEIALQAGYQLSNEQFNTKQVTDPPSML